MGILAIHFNFGIGWPNNSSTQLHKTVKIDLKSLKQTSLTIQEFYHYFIIPKMSYSEKVTILQQLDKYLIRDFLEGLILSKYSLFLR